MGDQDFGYTLEDCLSNIWVPVSLVSSMKECSVEQIQNSSMVQARSPTSKKDKDYGLFRSRGKSIETHGMPRYSVKIAL